MVAKFHGVTSLLSRTAARTRAAGRLYRLRQVVGLTGFMRIHLRCKRRSFSGHCQTSADDQAIDGTPLIGPRGYLQENRLFYGKVPAGVSIPAQSSRVRAVSAPFTGTFAGSRTPSWARTLA
jgi:hypothetical protein